MQVLKAVGQAAGAAGGGARTPRRQLRRPPAAPRSTPISSRPAAAGGYPGDNAQPEQYAAWMAAAAQKAGLPPQLPIMAALTGVGPAQPERRRRDSVGFFQMRTSVWDQGEYAGYGQNPDLQLKWFITRRSRSRSSASPRGETAFVADPGQWGQWIADVERPQEDCAAGTRRTWTPPTSCSAPS